MWIENECRGEVVSTALVLIRIVVNTKHDFGIYPGTDRWLGGLWLLSYCLMDPKALTHI